MKNDIKAISYDLVPSLSGKFKEVMVTYAFNGKTHHYSIFIELKKNFKEKDYLDEAKKTFNDDIKSGKVINSTKSIKAKGPKKPLYIALTATLGVVAVSMSGLFIWKMLDSGNKTEWKPIAGDADRPLTFICNENDSSIDFMYHAEQNGTDVPSREINLYCQIDKGNWTKVKGIHQISSGKPTADYIVPIANNVKKGQEIHLACDGGGYWSYYDYGDTNETLSLHAYGNFTVKNNVMSLKSRNNFDDLDLVDDYEFCRLFAKYNDEDDKFEPLPGLTDASGLLLPASNLENGCYSNMFNSNIKLEHAPTKLPADTLSDYCYDSMFSGCSSLITTPKLIAYDLADSCYGAMFLNCSSLTTAPVLVADKLDDNCYAWMFSGCISLIHAPDLFAFALADGCYRAMFSGCSSLVTAPYLPVNILDADAIYAEMFKDCTNLESIRVGFGTPGTWDWPDDLQATYGWLENAGTSVQGEKVFVWNGSDENEPAEWRSADRVPYGWIIKHTQV